MDELKREHGKFVAKVKSLDPNYKDVIPWQPRAYQRKRPHVHDHRGSHESHVTSEKQTHTQDYYHQLPHGHHMMSEYAQEQKDTLDRSHDYHVTSDTRRCTQEDQGQKDTDRTPTKKNVLQLDYSSSESSECEDTYTAAGGTKIQKIVRDQS